MILHYLPSPMPSLPVPRRAKPAEAQAEKETLGEGRGSAESLGPPRQARWGPSPKRGSSTKARGSNLEQSARRFQLKQAHSRRINPNKNALGRDPPRCEEAQRTCG